jgi:uncharacterized Zn-finger protein
MNRHYKTAHEEPLPFKCKECEHRFRRKIQLKKHQKVAHDLGEYTYSCQVCQAGFFNLNLYGKHLVSHKVKERACDECGQSFPNWTQLVKHKRDGHNILRRFQCDLCDKAFSRKPNLRQHMVLHLQKERVYACNYENCSKFYTAKRNLQAHIRSKHEGKHFMCEICKCKLSTKQKLDFHMEGHSDPVKSNILKKSNIAVLLGIQVHPKMEENLLEALPKSMLQETTTESEYSDF